jgi:hypothetical protein
MPSLAQPADADEALPFTGSLNPDALPATAVLIPSAQAAAAVDSTDPSATQDFFLMIVLGLMALPLVLIMTLVATVLVRR